MSFQSTRKSTLKFASSSRFQCPCNLNRLYTPCASHVKSSRELLQGGWGWMGLDGAGRGAGGQVKLSVKAGVEAASKKQSSGMYFLIRNSGFSICISLPAFGDSCGKGAERRASVKSTTEQKHNWERWMTENGNIFPRVLLTVHNKQTTTTVKTTVNSAHCI